MPLLKGVVKSVSFGERMRFARCMVNTVNCAMVSIGAMWMFGSLPAGDEEGTGWLSSLFIFNPPF